MNAHHAHMHNDRFAKLTNVKYFVWGCGLYLPYLINQLTPTATTIVVNNINN